MLFGTIGEYKVMSKNNVSSIRIVDISTFDGKDWELVTGVGKIGVSYCARHGSAKLTFKDDNENVNHWIFENDSVITFRGSNLVYDRNSKQN